MHIGVRHRAGSDHAPPFFRFQRLFQQLRCILLYLDILKQMCKLIAPASAVTVNAAMAASALDVHSVPAAAAGQYSLGINKMHVSSLQVFSSKQKWNSYSLF
jgi:hypothetical protein